jgi:hypothetical protein
MMKLNIFKYGSKVLLSTALVLGAGCSNFLDEVDPSNLTPDSFYTEAKHADAAIAAVYADARFLVTVQEYFLLTGNCWKHQRVQQQLKQRRIRI